MKRTRIFQILMVSLAVILCWGPASKGDSDWIISGSNMYSGVSGNVGIGTSTPAEKLTVNGTIRATSSLPTGKGVYGYASNSGNYTNYGGYFSSAGSTGRGVYGIASHTTGINYGIFGKTNSANGYAGYFQGGRNYFQGNVGIGTASPAYKLDVSGNIRATGTIYGSVDKLDGQHGSYYNNWNNLTNVPAGFADGVDNTGGIESDTLNTVCSRGSSTSHPITITNTAYLSSNALWAKSTSSTHPTIASEASNNNAIKAISTHINYPAIVAEAAGGNAIRAINSSVISPVISAEALVNTNAIKATNYSSSYPTLYVSQGSSINTGSYAGYFVGNLGCTGYKPATVETQSYGSRNLYADESAEIYFFDRGSSQLTNGTCVINLDPMFLETVTINDSYPMLVQITLTADCKGVFVSEKTNSSFTVWELQSGTSNATFDWEVAAKRKGYEDIRMEKITIIEEPETQAGGLSTTVESGEEDVRSTASSGVCIIRGE